jgi:predicted ATPase/transcriptional regulator with XRE-family HTH domain
LRTYRIAAQLSQEALAERSRMSVDAISALERGARRAPRRDTVSLLTEALRLGDAERASLETAAAEARPSRPRVFAPDVRDRSAGEGAGPAPLHNLPIPMTSFYGREHELETLVSEVVERRLTTITGFAGVGKTRLATEAGWKLIEHFPDGIHVVELAPLSDPDLVAPRIAAALGLPPQAGQLAGDLWVDALRERRALLIIDNCEHVLEAVSVTTQRLLQRCRDFRVLATSREALRLPGERVMLLAPLVLPAVDHQVADGRARDLPAISLFLDRVSDTAPDFKLLDNDVSGWRSVQNVCTKLDGIPLALELAAARVSTLGLPTLERGLDDRFRLLRGGARTALPRQQTLQATLDWSYAVLHEDEQRVFDRLGVFPGSFSSGAAEAVCFGDGIPSESVLDIVSSLVEKSLIVALDVAPTTRYRLLETTRVYALQRLEKCGGVLAARRRHAEYYHAQSLGSRSSFGTASFVEWAQTYAQELDNFRAALAWTIDERGDVMLGAAILWSLKRLLEWLNLNAEGLTWCNRALAALGADAPPAVEAGINMIATRLHMALGGFHAAIPTSERAAVLYRELGAELQLAYARTFLARALASEPESRARADELLDEALAVYSEAEHRAVVDIDPGEGELPRRLMNVLATAFKAFTIDPADIPRRRAFVSDAVERYAALSPKHFIIGVMLVNLAELELEAGDYEAAVERADESLEIYRAPGSSFGHIWALNAAATAELALGDLEAARSHACDLLAMARRLGSAPGLGMALLLLATIEADGGDPVRAGGLFGAWEACAGKVDTPAATTRFLCTRVHDALTARSDDIERAAAIGTGSRWTVDEAIDVALQVAERPPAVGLTSAPA